MSKAFNIACLHRIDPTAYHNDGNRFGRFLGCPDRPVPDRHDDINFEAHQLGCKLREVIDFSFRISIHDGDILVFYVAQLAES